MYVKVTTLKVLLVYIFIRRVKTDDFTQTSSVRTDLASKSSISTDVCCISDSCVGNTSMPNHINVLKQTSLDSICTTETQFPPNGNKENGHVKYNQNNFPNCTITDNFSEVSSYTLTFWLNNKCTSGNCSLVLSDMSEYTLVQFERDKLIIDGEQIQSKQNQWTFIAFRKNSKIGEVFINDNSHTTSMLPSTLSQIDIQPSNVQSGEGFSLVDFRLFKSHLLTDREIYQIYNNTDLDVISPHSECRCPDTHPTVYSDSNKYSLLCKNPDGDLTSRFKPNSIPEFITDGNETTSWKTTSQNVTVMIQLEAELQVDEIEVIMEASPCSLTMILDSGHNNAIVDPALNVLKWMSISNDIQNRSALEKVVTKNITIHIDGFCNQNYHLIKEILITGRCNCYGNANSCTYTSTGYTCNSCSGNTTGDNCGHCTVGYYRQEEDFGCGNTCQCNTLGSTSMICAAVKGQCPCKTNVEGHSCNTCKHLHYNLGSDNTNGCTRSPCSEDGTLQCSDNTTCSNCICKTNVKGTNCSQCDQYYYGISIFNEGCRPCNCNIAGIVNAVSDKQCHMTSGQCKCKTQVQGRTCDTCKDGYYGLNPVATAGCQECGCNKYGAKNMNCHQTTGQCDCDGQKINMHCDPNILNMVPTFGPKSGGTRVTLTGQLLGSGTPGNGLFVYKDKTSLNAYNVVSWNQTAIVFETGSSSTAMTTQLLIKWSTAYFQNSKDKIDNSRSFQFRADPVVSKAYSAQSFKSGGCDVRFEGSSLNSVYRPQLKSFLSGGLEKITDCSAIGSTVLICQSPDLTGNSDTKVSFGLLLDGVTMYSNLTTTMNVDLTIVPDPSVTTKQYDDYKMLFSDKITIQGTRLKEACQGNLEVTIGTVKCTIESADNTQIICKPDLSFPGVSQDSTDIMVTIGNFRMSAGKLKFISFWKTMEFIGIAIGVGVFVLLILVLVICCCCCRRKKKTFSGKSKTKKEKFQNGFDIPIAASSTNNLIEKEDVPRFSNRLYSEKHHLETALTYDETDCREDFLHKIESSVRDKIQKSVSDRKHIQPDKVCTLKGTEIRVITGKFSKESPNSGKELTIKTNIKTLKELLEGGKYPTWLNNGLAECMKFQDCIHDNILRILGIAVDQNRFYVLYPMSKRGFKEYLIDAKQDFAVKELLEMCVQIAQGMTYLSDENMVHKDLAARNCVVMADGVIKISDSSFSWNLYPNEYMFDAQRQRYLPVRWMALESLKMGYYDISSDVWSFGVLIWEVMTLSLYLPYHDQQLDESIKTHIDEGFRLGMPTNAPDELYQLMVNCWEAENHNRPSFDDIVIQLQSILSPNSEGLYANTTQSVAMKTNAAPKIPQRAATAGAVNKGFRS